MFYIIENNKEEDLINKKINCRKERKSRNNSLFNLFNGKFVKTNILKGDNCKIDNDELETKVNISIKKKINSPFYQEIKNVNSLSLYSNQNKFSSITPNKNNLNNSNINNDCYCTEASNKDTNSNPKNPQFSLSEKNHNEYDCKMIMEKAYKRGLISLNPSEIINENDKNNEFIYSYLDWHPFSFCTGHRKWGYENGKLKSPSPIFLDNKEWCERKILNKKDILKGILIKDDVGLLLVDPKICEKFTGMLSDLIKQILKVVLGHKISLNVKLFEPSSLSQTLLNYFSFIPKFILPASNPTLNPLDRMKYVISLGISGLYINAKQLKPFNPLISETFQGYFDLDNLNEENKIEVFSEQISNYPTLTRYYITNNNFKMYGYFDLSLETQSFGNKIICFTKGINTFDFFKINEKINFSIPSSKIINAIAKDDRSAHYVGVMIFYDLKNNLRAFVQFANDTKYISDIEGVIFRYNFPEDYKFNFDDEYKMFSKIDLKKKKKNNIFSEEDILSTISGSWLGKLYFDNIQYWDIDEDIPTYIRPVLNCLPSDSRFREDLIWLYRSFYKSKNEEERLYYESLAQNWKLMIEKVQREERTEKAKLNEQLAKRAKRSSK
jgi:hypothetical protein